MSDNSALKRLAEAAPGGPWVAENDSLYFKDAGYTRHMLDADAGHDVEDEAYYAALKFIAAANPAAVLALIAENERLENERAELWRRKRDVEAARDTKSAVIAELKAENERLAEEYDKAWRHDLNDKNNVQALSGEVARLSAENEALRRAAVKVIEMNRQHAEDQYGDSDKAESWSCVTVLRAAMGKGEQS